MVARGPVRHGASSNNCRFELTINSFIYESKVYTSRSLRLIASFRKFDAGQTAPSINFNSSAAAKLKIYPARKAEEIDAAMGELERAFITSI